jgi:hypothetical protein
MLNTAPILLDGMLVVQSNKAVLKETTSEIKKETLIDSL